MAEIGMTDITYRLKHILAAGPLQGYETQIIVFERGALTLAVSRPDGARFRLAGAAIFSAIDILASFTLWEVRGSVRSIFTTNMTWSCYRPVKGKRVEIRARILGHTLNFATIGVEILVTKPGSYSAATCTATAYLRGYDGDLLVKDMMDEG